MTKLEEIARIIDPEPWDEDHWKAAVEWYGSDTERRQRRAKSGALDDARAVIKALMEPTDTLADIGTAAYLEEEPLLSVDGIAAAWRAMLQAILDEKPNA